MPIVAAAKVAELRSPERPGSDERVGFQVGPCAGILPRCRRQRPRIDGRAGGRTAERPPPSFAALRVAAISLCSRTATADRRYPRRRTSAERTRTAESGTAARRRPADVEAWRLPSPNFLAATLADPDRVGACSRSSPTWKRTSSLSSRRTRRRWTGSFPSRYWRRSPSPASIGFPLAGQLNAELLPRDQRTWRSPSGIEDACWRWQSGSGPPGVGYSRASDVADDGSACSSPSC